MVTTGFEHSQFFNRLLKLKIKTDFNQTTHFSLKICILRPKQRELMHAQPPFSKPVFYLAPLQGFTDYSFRQAYYSLFEAPDFVFSPFIETHKPDHRAYRDVLPERNTGVCLIPQVLGNNAAEMRQVIVHLNELGYSEVNWNLGCPYPMVAKKQMGAGLLPFPHQIDAVLNELYRDASLKLSVKMRLGLTNPNEWKELVPVLNRYPITEVIIHGRTASQMYKGEVNVLAFLEMVEVLLHPVCYNGNINSLEDFQSLLQRMPFVSRWMIGRGLIANPLLVQEIKTNTKATPQEIKTAINRLHDQLMYQNSIRLSGESHLMHKVKPYWEYFAQSLPEDKKGIKKIKKTTTLSTYINACKELLD
jgi:tRNA-dihydrouridine synthase